MTIYLLIGGVNKNKNPDPVNEAFTEEEKELKLQQMKSVYPEAFAIEVEDLYDLKYVTVDFKNKTAIYDAAAKTAADTANEALQDLQKTDVQMSRIAEDILDALISKGTLALTDLPQAAQDTIDKRKNERSKLNGN